MNQKKVKKPNSFDLSYKIRKIYQHNVKKKKLKKIDLVDLYHNVFENY